MGFLDDARASSVRSYPNKIDQIKAVLSKKDYAEFMEAMLDPTISQVAITEALKKRGVHIGKGTISEHRRDLMRQGEKNVNR